MRIGNFSQPVKENKGLKHGQIVDCILLEKHYTPAHLKSISEQNKFIKEEAEQLKEEPVLIKPSYKIGGVAWRIAVLRVVDSEGEGESIWKQSGDSLIKPDFIATCYFQHLPPSDHLKIQSKNGKLYGDLFRRGGDTKLINDRPKIIDLFPSVNPVLDRETGMRADEVTDTDKYKGLLMKEKERKLAWEEIISMYDNGSEEECSDWLDDIIARRLLICECEGTASYLKLQPGIKFRACVDNYNNGFYFNIKGIGDWNKNKRQFDTYSTFECRYPGSNDLLAVSLIKEALSEVIEEEDDAVRPNPEF